MRKLEQEASKGHFNAGYLTLDGVRLHGGESRLSLAPATVTLVIGANGSGKSYFLEKLAGLRNPDGMEARYGDEALWLRRRWSLRGSRRLNPRALLQYGYAGQMPEQGLLMRTLEAEIQYSLRPYARQAAWNVSGRSNAHADQALAAVGWDRSWLQRDPHRMSGGERRRAALAALFATPAAWLLLDEPTAGLDRDGHERLARHLTQLKDSGHGVVLVSHDLDWALPLADRVLLFRTNRTLMNCGPDELIVHPEWLVEAGLRVPSWMRAAASFGAAGANWRNPEALAQAIVAMAGSKAPQAQTIGKAALGADSRDGTDRLMGADGIGGQVGPDRQNRPNNSNRPDTLAQRQTAHRLTLYDPRAIWLGYVLLSIGLFSLSTWPGLLIGAAVVIGLLGAARIPLRRWKGIIVGYILFGLVFSGWAALAFSGRASYLIEWDNAVFTGTLFPFVRTLIVLLIGLGVPLVMSPLSLRRALEQLVPQGRRMPAFWQRIVLTITLTIRFVPVLLSEWERFGRIFLSRGKELRRTPGAVIRRLRDIALPLLLALFRLADEVSLALESRGVRPDEQPTRGTRLQWRQRDTLLAGGMALLGGLLWWLG